MHKKENIQRFIETQHKRIQCHIGGGTTDTSSILGAAAASALFFAARAWLWTSGSRDLIFDPLIQPTNRWLPTISSSGPCQALLPWQANANPTTRGLVGIGISVPLPRVPCVPCELLFLEIHPTWIRESSETSPYHQGEGNAVGRDGNIGENYAKNARKCGNNAEIMRSFFSGGKKEERKIRADDITTLNPFFPTCWPMGRKGEKKKSGKSRRGPENSLSHF